MGRKKGNDRWAVVIVPILVLLVVQESCDAQPVEIIAGEGASTSLAVVSLGRLATALSPLGLVPDLEIVIEEARRSTREEALSAAMRSSGNLGWIRTSEGTVVLYNFPPDWIPRRPEVWADDLPPLTREEWWSLYLSATDGTLLEVPEDAR